MKKKPIIITSIVIAVILLALFLPIPKGTYDDGGTKEYDALLYKIVVWNRAETETGKDGNDRETRIYHKTSVFWFPDNGKSIDELWETESNSR